LDFEGCLELGRWIGPFVRHIKNLLTPKNVAYCFVPNQRAKNKVRLGGFVDRKLYRAVVALAKQEGMEHNKFGFAQKLILEGLALRENRSRKRRSVTDKTRSRTAFPA
jgi:hypothetical protein